MYLKAAASVYLNIIFSIYRYQRDFTKHLYDRVCLGVRIIFNIIFNLVHIHFYQRFLCHNLNLPQFFGGICNIQRPEVHQLFTRLYREVLHNTVTTDRSDGHYKITRTGHLLLELAFHVRYQHLQGACGSLFLHDSNCGIRLTLLSKRVKQDSFDLERSSCRVLCYCQPGYQKHPQQHGPFNSHCVFRFSDYS